MGARALNSSTVCRADCFSSLSATTTEYVNEPSVSCRSSSSSRRFNSPGRWNVQMHTVTCCGRSVMTGTARSFLLDELPLKQLARQDAMNVERVVLAPADVVLHHPLQAGALEIRPAQRARIKQHFLQVIRQRVAIPDAEVIELVPAQEQLLEMQRGKSAVHLRQPIRHAVVVGILGLEGELLVKMPQLGGQRRGLILQAPIRAHPA